jgi:hypothetical protein
MTVIPIDINFELPQDKLMDIFLLQWSTPILFHHYNPTKINDHTAGRRGALLTNFKNWLTKYFINIPPRPLFILSPELSMPVTQIPVLNDLIANLNRPAVIITGLEYMPWNEYADLVKSLDDMPDKQLWTQDGIETNHVNAANILIRDSKGNIRRFIQPKLHPEDHEQAKIYSGHHLFLFKTNNQHSGQRLNFSVQICSDFCSTVHVRNFRQLIDTNCPQTPLDLTFLLQCNKDQEAQQFKESVRQYFDVPDGMVPTTDGCLLFINNANRKHNKSSKWGQSKIFFPFSKKWRLLNLPVHTYWLADDGPNDYQALLLRESGPGFYWLTYKPQYLVSRIPGSGQSTPFPQNGALYAAIHGTDFGNDMPKKFSPILAMHHWLKCEWIEGKETLSQDLLNRNVDVDVVSNYKDLYDNNVNSWLEKLDNNEIASTEVVRILSMWCQTCDQCNNIFKDSEPNAWSNNMSNAIKEMMSAYTLIRLGSDKPVSPLTNCYCHAKVEREELYITFLWGCSRSGTQDLITKYLQQINAEGNVCINKDKVLVLINAHDIPPNNNELLNIIDRAKESIVNITTHDLPSHLRQGNVVQVEEPKLNVILNNYLNFNLNQSGNPEDLEHKLRVYIGELIA